MLPVRNFCLFVMSLLVSGALWAIDLSVFNLDYLRNPNADVRVSYRVIQPERNLFTVILSVQTADLSKWKAGYYAQSSYQSEQHQILSPQVRQSQDSLLANLVMLNFTTDQNLLVLEYTIEEEEQVRFFPIPLSYAVEGLNLIPLVNERPLLNPYLSTQDYNWNLDESLYYTSYTGNYGPADAPMDEMKPLFPKFDYDTLIDARRPELEDGHLYVVNTDSLADDGIYFLKTAPYYPKLRRIDELVLPLKYITTEVEYQSLLSSENSRKTFDEFWLSTFGTKFRARNAIRRYYQSVEEANQMFTTIKEGWKTDRGMIYIVFGPPDEVYLDDRGETWVYDNVAFDFVRVGTVFGTILGLTRDKRFEKVWYNKVGNLRRTL